MKWTLETTISGLAFRDRNPWLRVENLRLEFEGEVNKFFQASIIVGIYTPPPDSAAHGIPTVLMKLACSIGARITSTIGDSIWG